MINKGENIMKNIYNGKIEKGLVGYVTCGIVLFSSIMSIGSIFLVLLALFYENVENNARVFLYIISGISLLLAIIHPIITIHFIRIYPKHSKFTTKFLIKKFVFIDLPESE